MENIETVTYAVNNSIEIIELFCSEKFTYDELEEYEIKSAKNIIYKKSTTLEQDEIKQFLLKKGYKLENINKALES